LATDRKNLETDSILSSRPRSQSILDMTRALVSAAVLAALVIGLARPSSASPGPFAALESRLVGDGFDKSVVEGMYARPEMTFDNRCVSVYFFHREAALNYDQFLTQVSIGRASSYMRRYASAFERAGKLYGVDREVITAILWWNPGWASLSENGQCSEPCPALRPWKESPFVTRSGART